MKAVCRVSSLLIVFFMASCSSENLGPGGSTIVGTWRLYEQGYSPGSGYYVDSIPALPLQSLTFRKNGEVSKQGDQISGIFTFPCYRVITSQDKLRLKFLNSNKDEAATSDMSLRIVGDTMQIRPSCREGCHYGFVRTR